MSWCEHSNETFLQYFYIELFTFLVCVWAYRMTIRMKPLNNTFTLSGNIYIVCSFNF